MSSTNYFLYDLKEFEHHEPEEIELVKEPEDGYYTVRATPRLKGGLTPRLVFKDDEPAGGFA